MGSKWYFHWKYGSLREQSSVEQRNLKPYHSFMTNNFLIPKSIFLAIRFEEALTQYGHEDTLFGMELQRRGVPIVHLANPLRHGGLEAEGKFSSYRQQQCIAAPMAWFFLTLS